MCNEISGLPHNWAIRLTQNGLKKQVLKKLADSTLQL